MKANPKFLIANECLNSIIKYGEPSVLCKLDLEKAYDHVNWSLLLYMPRSGSERKWSTWIAHCISSPSVHFSILVNDTPSSFLIAPVVSNKRPFVSTVVDHCDGNF
jgi:hypothetical protein